jgi:hypothetical protein
MDRRSLTSQNQNRDDTNTHVKSAGLAYERVLRFKTMPKDFPSRPIDAYKAIIDQLVTETSHGVSERLVAEEGFFSNAEGEESENSFVQSLSNDQRQVLSRMLHVERTSAIHDVLANLTWWITTHGVRLTFQGETMPVELSGMGLHGDYVGRLNGWEWPGSGEKPT